MENVSVNSRIFEIVEIYLLSHEECILNIDYHIVLYFYSITKKKKNLSLHELRT